MRDPDLVYRAERAAIALERAWGDWRVMHGAGTGPLPQITSYVGYSLTEPWGEPRVVLGVPADEAERLAALLEGHDCFGPVHAEVASRPDWRRGSSGGQAEAGGRSYDGPIDVPAQIRGPEADQLQAGWQGRPQDADSDRGDSAGNDRAARDRAARDWTDRDSAARDRAARERLGERPWDEGLLGYRTGLPDDDTSLPEDSAPGSTRPSVSWNIPAVPLLPVPENGQPEPTRPAQPVPGQVPVQGGPGYRGPRYLGSPPQYQPEIAAEAADPDDPAELSGPGWEAGAAHANSTATAEPERDVDLAELEQAGVAAATAADAAATVADIAAEDDPDWPDLGPGIATGGADEAGPDAKADAGAEGVIIDAELAASAEFAADTDQAGAATIGEDQVGATEVADRPAGKGTRQPVRTAARKAARQTRSAAGRAGQPPRASAATAAEPAPAVGPEPEPVPGDPDAADEASQSALTGAEGADEVAPSGAAEDDLPGELVAGKQGRPRSRSVARLSRSRRTTPGAHEGSGWPPSGRTAKNSKV